MKNGLQHGQGIETFPDGAKYEGQFVNGKKHGIGKNTWANGSICYVNWVENKLQGFGKYNWPDGRKYVGSFFNSLMEAVLNPLEAFSKYKPSGEFLRSSST